MGGRNKIVVFNLPDDTRESDLEDLFDKFGRINRIAIRNGRNARLAFLEFDDRRDAEDAIDRRHDYEYRGNRIRVEFSTGERRRDSRRRGRSSRRRGGGGGRRGGGGRTPRPGPGGFKLNPTWHKVSLKGMPDGSSWQDMKDFLRPTASAKFTEATGTDGMAGFATKDEAMRVVEELNDAKFRSRNGDEGRVKITYVGTEGGDDAEGDKRSRSRSAKKQSRSRSEKKRSEKRSRSRSERKEKKGSKKSDSKSSRSRSGDSKSSRSRS